MPWNAISTACGMTACGIILPPPHTVLAGRGAEQLVVVGAPLACRELSAGMHDSGRWARRGRVSSDGSLSVISRGAVGPWTLQRSVRSWCAPPRAMDVKLRPPNCYAPHEVAGSRGVARHVPSSTCGRTAWAAWQVSPCRMAQGRSVKKKKSVFSSNAVCRPERWRFERRFTHLSATVGAHVRQGAALLRDARREDHRRRSVHRDGAFIDVELQLIRGRS
jgi:hypothetical protein